MGRAQVTPYYSSNLKLEVDPAAQARPLASSLRVDRGESRGESRGPVGRRATELAQWDLG